MQCRHVTCRHVCLWVWQTAISLRLERTMLIIVKLQVIDGYWFQFTETSIINGTRKWHKPSHTLRYEEWKYKLPL